jgi:hypothetical protein
MTRKLIDYFVDLSDDVTVACFSCRPMKIRQLMHLATCCPFICCVITIHQNPPTAPVTASIYHLTGKGLDVVAMCTRYCSCLPNSCAVCLIKLGYRYTLSFIMLLFRLRKWPLKKLCNQISNCDVFSECAHSLVCISVQDTLLIIIFSMRIVYRI